MSLFPHRWSGGILLPPTPSQNKRVGENHVYHAPTAQIEATGVVEESEHRGYWLLKTEMQPPFDQFLIRSKRARKIDSNIPILTCLNDGPCEEWGDSVAFRWDNPEPLLSGFQQPELVRKNWLGSFSFSSAKEEDGVGLRRPQLGAVHAVSAHFAVGKNCDDAIVVLPTGTGKTETMLALLAYSCPKRLLVLVPSDVLRSQIGTKFREFGILRELGCIPKEAINPRVGVIKTGIRTVEEARELAAQANVIVALPNTLEASDPQAVEELCRKCSDLFVDEAHHVTATTWHKIKQRFGEKRTVLFTATPFRRNREHIGGKIVFNYKLGDAQDDGYYKSIRLETVEEFGEESRRNRAIAERAISILREDLNAGYDHILMARVKSKSQIDQVISIYRELADDLNPVAVYSGPGRRAENLQSLKDLKGEATEKSRIVVCVNMLGEGFDLPQLKIAAIHDNHKSLAVTLQFVGRFTRMGENIGDAAVVINTADPKAEKGLEDLYSTGADWDHVVRRLSEGRIENELQLESVIDDLKKRGSLHDKISLWNLRPSMSTQIYKTKCEDWAPERFHEAFQENAQQWHSIGVGENVLVLVDYQESAVKWGRFENLWESSYGLLVAHWDSENRVLFLNASDYDQMKAAQVARAVTSEGTELLNGDQVFRVLNGVELPLAKNLGSSRIGAISFTSYFGPNVTEGLASIEKSESELNNIACLGYEGGEKVVLGAAKKKGKIWQQGSGSIDDWLKWCRKTYQKVSRELEDESNITEGFLRPVTMTNLPEVAPISIQWGEYLQSSFAEGICILFDGNEVPLYLADVILVENAEPEEIRFSICSEQFSSTFSFRVSPEFLKGYEYRQLSGPAVAFRISRRTTRQFEDQMYVDPLIVRYSDGTFSYNNFHIPIDFGAEAYPIDKVEAWDWGGIPLNRESMGKDRAVDTIQYRCFERVRDEFDVIFNDDGPGEAGDLVGLKSTDSGEIRLCLVHCKNAKGGLPSGQIANLYEVCGQAQKSISAKHEGLKKLATSLKRRHEKWLETGHSRILKGDLQQLNYFVEKSRKARLSFEVIIVQPGLSKARMSRDIAKLLATTELFLKRTTDAEFRVVWSE